MKLGRAELVKLRGEGALSACLRRTSSRSSIRAAFVRVFLVRRRARVPSSLTLQLRWEGGLENPHPDNHRNTKIRWLHRMREHLGLPPRELWMCVPRARIPPLLMMRLDTQLV